LTSANESAVSQGSSNEKNNKKTDLNNVGKTEGVINSSLLDISTTTVRSPLSSKFVWHNLSCLFKEVKNHIKIIIIKGNLERIEKSMKRELQSAFLGNIAMYLQDPQESFSIQPKLVTNTNKKKNW
jgi:hypothetical protein